MLPLTENASFFGTVQPLTHHLAPRLRVQAPLVSIGTFSSEPSTSSQQSSWTQQLVRPGISRPPSTEAVSPAVSSNVQVLGAGLRTGAPAARAPAERRYRRKPKLRVAVDVDEVLGRFLHSLNKFCQEEYGLHYDVSDYAVYEFAKIWNCSTDRSNFIVHEFFKSRHFASGILPIPGAFHSLQRLGQSCELVVVTSRQHCIQAPTLAWVEQHFPGVFSEVHFGNHWALEGHSKAKSEICREVGASVLIDDNPRYAVECAAAGIDVLLYDWNLGYPWSKTPEGGESPVRDVWGWGIPNARYVRLAALRPTHPLIRRVKDWTEVEEALAALAVRGPL